MFTCSKVLKSSRAGGQALPRIVFTKEKRVTRGDIPFNLSILARIAIPYYRVCMLSATQTNSSRRQIIEN